MKSPETFKAVMQQKSDAELIEILHHFREEYRPEALTAANWSWYPGMWTPYGLFFYIGLGLLFAL